MGSLDLLSQAKTRMNFTSKYKFWVWTKTSWETKSKMAIRKKWPFLSISFQEMFNGFTKAKMTSTNPQFLDLSSHPLSITKNEFPTKNRLIKWGKTPWEPKMILASIMGHYGSRYGPNKHQKREFLLHMHSTTQKWDPSHEEKWRNCRKREGESTTNSSCVREANTTSKNP